jgi:hypothetical protein
MRLSSPRLFFRVPQRATAYARIVPRGACSGLRRRSCARSQTPTDKACVKQWHDTIPAEAFRSLPFGAGCHVDTSPLSPSSRGSVSARSVLAAAAYVCFGAVRRTTERVRPWFSLHLPCHRPGAPSSTTSAARRLPLPLAHAAQFLLAGLADAARNPLALRRLRARRPRRRRLQATDIYI